MIFIVNLTYSNINNHTFWVRTNTPFGKCLTIAAVTILQVNI